MKSDIKTRHINDGADYLRVSAPFWIIRTWGGATS